MSGSFNNLLAVDTAERQLKLAVSFGGDRLVQAVEPVMKSHGQILLKKISDLLSSANVRLDQLEALIVGIGPGSFTGLRIGVAAVKGMATALDLPVIGIDRFSLLAARRSPDDSPVVAWEPHTREEATVARIDGDLIVDGSIQLLPHTQLETYLAGAELVGLASNPAPIVEALGITVPVSTADFAPAEFIALGRTQLLAGHVADLAALEPLYVEKSTAERRLARNS